MKKVVKVASDNTSYLMQFDKIIGNIIKDIADDYEVEDTDSLISIAIDEIVNSDLYWNEMPKWLAYWIQENEQAAEDAIAKWISANMISSDKPIHSAVDLNDYDDGYVELCDGQPLFVYSKLKDAQNGVFWDQMGDNQYGNSQHDYEIKLWRDGQLIGLSEE